MRRHMNYANIIDKDTREAIIYDNVLTPDEKSFFDCFLKNYTTNEIAKIMNCSARTVSYRKTEIYEKLKKSYIPNIDEEARDNYKVYVLLFPNKKVYVGSCYAVFKRWANGKGYQENKELNDAIEKYGWNNIKKYIIYSGLTYKEAQEKETETIVIYKSYMEDYGYNKRVLY